MSTYKTVKGLEVFVYYEDDSQIVGSVCQKGKNTAHRWDAKGVHQREKNPDLNLIIDE